MKPSTFMPYAGTDIARQVNSLYEFMLWVSVIGFLVLIGGMIYFIIRYKRQSATAKSAYITHDSRLEFLWSFIPFVIFMVVFGWGWYIYVQMRTMPKDALEIQVTGRQWSWSYTYKSGKKSTDLYVPVGKPVKLIMTSEDVIHSYYIPAFRIKQDVLPGRYTAEWFQAEKPGTYQVFCTEYCGAIHSGMLSKVKAIPLPEFEAWLSGGPVQVAGGKELSLVEQGKKLFNERSCTQCHSVENKIIIGPHLNGVFGHTVELKDGSKVNADENYIRESILNPQAKIVKGFEAQMMPSFAGQFEEKELSAIIEFIKSVK